jgi:hypothetical protein
VIRRCIGRAALPVSVAVAMTTPASPAQAQQHVTRPYVVEGPGRATCADFVAWAPGGEERRLGAAWLTGYMTAHHRLMPGVFDLTAWQTPALLMGLMEQYCTSNPDAIVERGAQELVAYLTPRALTEEAELVAVRNGSAVVLVYRPVLTQVRDGLEGAGFAAASDEAGLIAALTAYQTAQGLEPTGLPDQATLARLLK